MNRWGSLSAGIALGVLLFGGQARAQTPEPSPGGIEDDSRKADELFKQGKKAYGSGKLQEAHDAYLRAWELKRSHDIASNLANSEMQLGMKREAAEHLSYCVRNFPPTVDEAKRQSTVRRFEQARAEVGALLIRVNVRGAEVFVDGRSVGTAPLEAEIYAAPGERVIEARLAEHEPAVAKLVVVKAGAKGAAREVTLSLVPKAKGLVVLPPPEKLRPEGPKTALLVAGGSLTGASLLAGAVLTIVANKKAGDAVSTRDAIVKAGPAAACTVTPSVNCQALQGAMTDQARLSNGAAWSFIAAGALGAGTLIYAVAAPRARASALRVGPLVAAEGGGIVVWGEW